MKTIELSGATLDYWVAMAEKASSGSTSDPIVAPTEHAFVGVVNENGPVCYLVKTGKDTTELRPFCPSSNHRLARQIMAREHIEVFWHVDGWRSVYMGAFIKGESYLVAAMRCRVWMVYGDTVPEAAPEM